MVLCWLVVLSLVSNSKNKKNRIVVTALASSSSSSSKATTTTTIPNLLEISNQALAYASVHGIQMECTTDDDDTSDLLLYQCAPISLLPNAYPKWAFEKAKRLAQPLNCMVDSIARHPTFLSKTLRTVSETDPFTAHLLSLYERIYHSNEEEVNYAKIADSMGIQRSDYMLTKSTSSDGEKKCLLKQVELNTIASSFAGLSVQVSNLHRYLVTSYSKTLDPFKTHN